MYDSGCIFINGFIDKKNINKEQMENLNAIADKLKVELTELLKLIAK